jgi:hypothetical protein
VQLVFGDGRGDHLAFELGAAENGFLLGPIVLARAGHPDVALTGRNGIEGRALASLRADLESLRSDGRGNATFGDHDFPSMVWLRAQGDGVVNVTVDLPSEDLWDIELPAMSMTDLDGLSTVVAAAERAFGPLVGYCGACGVPEPTFELLEP